MPSAMEGGRTCRRPTRQHRGSPGVGRQGLEALHARIAGRFARAEPRRRVLAYCVGCWATWGARTAGSWPSTPARRPRTGCSGCLATAAWDADLVRDDLRAYVVEHLGDPGGVLVVDETGFLKKGTTSVGVQRQYSGTAGKVDNCQLGVFLAYASANGAGVHRPGAVPAPGLDRGSGPLPGRPGARGGRVLDQAAAGPSHAPARPGRRGPGRLGDRRRGLRRRPGPAALAGGPRPVLCAGGEVHRATAAPRGVGAGAPPPSWPPGAGRAVGGVQRRPWRQGPTAV